MESPAAATSELQTRTMRRVAARLTPVLLGLYIIARAPRSGGRFKRTKVTAKPVQPVA